MRCGLKVVLGPATCPGTFGAFPMKLYFSPGACSLSPHIVLREAALSFDLEQVDLRTKTTSTGGNFFTINAKGQVPALLLDDGDILTEGPAIVQYIADMVPAMKLVPPAGSRERYHLQEWLNFITSELHKNFSPLFRSGTPETYKSIAIDLIADRFCLVDKHLAGRTHLMGENFTVSDAYLFYMTHAAQRVGMDLNRWPNLAAFRERIASRPKVQDAMRVEGLQKFEQSKTESPRDILQDLRTALRGAGSGSSSVKIGVVDGLPDLAHPALQNASIEVLNTMIPEGSSSPDKHGTSVCSVIFGDSEAVQGIAPRCSGLVLPSSSEIKPMAAQDPSHNWIWRGLSLSRSRTTFLSSTSAPARKLRRQKQTSISIRLCNAAQNVGF